MTDIFISYSRDDRAKAAEIAARLHEEDGWDVFWDREIKAGSEWNTELQRRLEKARCVLVLWSKQSRKSLWVQGEAARAFERDVYFPVSIDDAGPPRLFRNIQSLSLEDWNRSRDPQDLAELRQSVESRIGRLAMYGTLEKVADDEPVTAAHLHLIHSCWRVDRHSAFGQMPYQIHLIVFGHYSATSRIASVEYHLPGYPEGHQTQKGGAPERLFELKELANGFCVAQAHVELNHQPAGHSKFIRLSRLIKMSESGPRLLADFVRRTHENSRLGNILYGLPAVEAEAERLLGSIDESETKRRLTGAGYPPAMVDAAIASAAARLRRS